MDEIDDILGTKNYQKNNYKNNYNNKDNWKQQQQKERQEIYNIMDKMSKFVTEDNKKFKQYLDIQSKFTKYSVGNCLVILEKAPYSTQIRDKKSWQEKGVSLIDNAKSIKILEPSKSSNGRIYYNPKDVYDISQTTATKPSDIEFDTRKLLESIIYTCDIPRKSVEQLPNGSIGSQYNKEENLLYVCKGMDRETLFQSLFQEIANIEMRSDEDNDLKFFRSYCVSYMLCKRFGIECANYSFDNPPKEFSSNNDSKDIRKELDIIRGKFEKINARMIDYLRTRKSRKKQISSRKVGKNE